MFKKFKDRLTEVSEEVKRDPRFVNSIASVNQLAKQTYSALNKTEKSGSRESLTSITTTNNSTSANLVPASFSELQQQSEFYSAGTAVVESTSHRRSLSSDFQAFFEPKSLTTSASSPSLANTMAAANNR